MCFKWLNRLMWLALVFVSVLITIGLGLFTYMSGAVDLGQREMLILAGAFVAVTVILAVYFRQRSRRPRPGAIRAVPPPVPWYNPPRSLAQRIYEPPVPAESTPSHPSAPMIVRTSRTISNNEHGDTRPMRRVEVPRLPTEVDEDTKPTKAIRLPVIPPKKAPPGPYDDLFPPAQPGDEDYLETSHMEPVPGQPEQPPTLETENKQDVTADEEPAPEAPSDKAEQAPPDDFPT